MLETTKINITLDSNTINLDQAVVFAQKFLVQKNAQLPITSAETIIKDGKPYFHVINAIKGFVILSSDSTYSPVLAYDNINNFSTNDKDINPGIALWFNTHSYQLDFFRNSKSEFTDSVSKLNKLLWKAINNTSATTDKKNTKNLLPSQNGFVPNGQIAVVPTLISSVPYSQYTSASTIGPFCQTYWTQGPPYNQFCPTIGGTHCLTGCVPMAMAQIMYYWQYPTTYNWSSMVKYYDYNNPNTWYANNPLGYSEPARLLKDIGEFNVNIGGYFVGAFANYGTTLTSSVTSQSPYVFSGFGYSSPGSLGGYQGTSTPLFSGPGNNSYTYIIANEILNNRPCMVSGFTDETNHLITYTPAGVGHCWVGDGLNTTTLYQQYLNTYSDGSQSISTVQESSSYLLHMNWGWGIAQEGSSYGNNDGWFDYNNYTNTPIGNLKYFQQIIYNIHP